MVNATAATVAKELYELAYSVSDRVELHNVILADCHAMRAPDLSSTSGSMRGTTVVSGISHAKSTELKQIHIMVSFVFYQGTDDEKIGPLSIKASFVLFYSVSSFDGIDDERIEAFGQINGVFNAWPYWREFVQNTTSRMGLAKPIVIPVFRLGAVEQTAEHTGEHTP
jgi:hypothetical protein